jgi:signal transduction histidine kinase/CheY-like chemotaxis protein
MDDRLDEPQLRIIVLAGEGFDSLRFRRAFKECGFPCSLTALPLELERGPSAEERLTAAAQKCDAILVDLERISPKDAPALVDGLSRLGVPAVGLLPPRDDELFSACLEAGLDAYAFKCDAPSLACQIPSVVMWAIDRHRDAQARNRVVEALRHKERQWTAMMNACLSLITYHDAEGRILWSNAIETDRDNRRIDPLAGTLNDEIWRPDNRAGGECPVPRAIRTGLPHEDVVVSLDGYKMLQRAFPVVGDDGRTVGAIASTLDTSALTPAEEVIKVAVRAQASATLAGGIAHKFNDLMAGVMANVNLLLQDAGDGHEMAPALREIEDAALAAGRLSDHLLAFARGGKYLPKILDVNGVVSDAVLAQKRAGPGGIVVDTALDAALWRVEANQVQLNLVVAQLISNAIEATGATGRVTISTRNAVVDGSDAEIEPWIESGRYAVIEVTDDGCGMTPEIRAKMFEPFFSTKGRGRGLGLAGVYGVVRSHGGHVTVRSEIGEGTRVIVFLPATNLEELPIAELGSGTPRPIAPVAPGRGETVLVVDDEDIVRHAVARYLKRCGYRVLTAADGESALGVCATTDGPIHAAVLDMIMPGLDGFASFRGLKESRPGMAIVVMSGYDRETYERPLLDAGAQAFLQKPVPMDVLAAAIREALDAGAALGGVGGKAIE